MKRASIVSIGNDLLMGQTIDTNASYLARQLFSVGIPVINFYTAEDSIESIAWALHDASKDADVILVTGGLGPTDDDVTRQAIAEFLGVELQMKEELLEAIRRRFELRGLQMPERNKIQAYIPKGTIALANSCGTAAGIMVNAADKMFFVMPGVPSEMERMFEDPVSGELKKIATDQSITMRQLKCFGAGESVIAEMIGNLMLRGRNPLINCTVRYGVVTLYIVAAAADKKRAEQLVSEDEKLLRNILGKLVYGEGEQTLAEVVGAEMQRQKKTLAVVESCTGGAIAKLITDVPGASRYFTHGWVTYSNEAKISEVGVPSELIEKYGAVSAEVAAAMAEYGRKKAGTDFVISTTGIAGPDGRTETKPVGLVYISVNTEKMSKTEKFIFPQSRDLMRIITAQTALNMLRLIL